MNEQPTVISTSFGRRLPDLQARDFLSPGQEITYPSGGVAPADNLQIVSGQVNSEDTRPLLEQLSDEEFWRYARELAYRAPALAQPAGQAQDLPLLVCKLSGGQCLVPLATLYEVVQPPHRLALLPAVPQWMAGIVAWRGETIAVIDLDAYLTGQHVYLPGESMLLIADYAGLPLGLLVSSIGQSIALQNAETLRYLPSRAAFVKGIQDGALVLDIPLLLADVVQEIETAASNG